MIFTNNTVKHSEFLFLFRISSYLFQTLLQNNKTRILRRLQYGLTDMLYIPSAVYHCYENHLRRK
jgi:hypothetical protein